MTIVLQNFLKEVIKKERNFYYEFIRKKKKESRSVQAEENRIIKKCITKINQLELVKNKNKKKKQC